MITANELARGIFAAYRLALLDRTGPQWLDDSVRGFWNSFWAAAVVAPGHLVLVALSLANAGPDVDPMPGGPLHVALKEALAYVIGWTAFPLVMSGFAGLIDREQRYLRYIAAYNWSAVIQMAVYLPVAAFASTGLLGEGLGQVLQLLAFAWALFYSAYIARHVLETGWMEASTIVFIDLAIAFLIRGFA